jgi:hypothetical protein
VKVRSERNVLKKSFKEKSKRKEVGMKIAGGREVEKWGEGLKGSGRGEEKE